MPTSIQRGFSNEDVSGLTCSNSLASSQREARVHCLADLFDVVAVTHSVHREVDAAVDQAHVSFRHIFGPTTLPLCSASHVANLEVSTARPLGIVGIDRDQLGVVYK